MVQRIDAALKAQLLSDVFRPAITLWNRLEGRPRSADFERSLRAEIRDPLWMLTRQWQFGEFKGEDAGSAVKARVQLNTSRIDRYAVKSERAVPYDNGFPLETEVEREILLEDGPDAHSADLALRSRMGRHWMRLLEQAGLGTPDVKTAVLRRFHFDDVLELPAPDSAEQLEAAHVQSEPAAWQALQAVKGRLPDGRKVLQAIGDGGFDSFADGELDASRAQLLKDLARDFRNWFHRLYSQPQTGVEDAWAPSYLEYQFAVSAPEDPSGEKRAVLVAEQYHQGQLDWYGLDIDPRGRLEDLPETQFPENGFAVRPPRAFLPSQIEFSGMPNVRLWELEDRRTDFGSIRAGTADVPLLLLAEFGLIYGNDWTVVPYDLEVGTLAEIKGIVVTDVFGVRTLIRKAGQWQRMDWQKWSMYDLTVLGGGTDDRLFLPPSVAKVQEGDPIERVILARDEMTNMVWAVEDRIPGISGNGVDGFEAATALANLLAPGSPVAPPPNEAKIRYVLGTAVPENWIPFIATHKPGSNRQIRLQRASMPRLTTPVEPRGKILRVGLPSEPYFVHEEEVPRAGAIVTRGYQRARWFDGRVLTWLGRRKETGRGESASGLAFDQIVSAERARPGG